VADDNNDLYIGVKSDLSPFNIDLNALTRGLVVIGQSGCGKSFLLGRLIEEIYQQTTDKTQILIFDPNSDFYYGAQLKDDEIFQNTLAKYHSGQLERQHCDFKALEESNYTKLKSSLKNTMNPNINDIFNLSWMYIIRNYYRYFKVIKGNLMMLTI
jgi:ABC-type proline/glycine betaine transport system ATPase subunit